MKEILKVVMVMVLLSFTTIHVYAQNDLDSILLQGTWTFDYDTSLANLDIQSKNHVYNMKPTIRKMLEKNYRNRQITFFENGDYLQEFSDGRLRKGNWSYPNGTILEISNPKGRVNSFIIVVISNSKLFLKPIIKGKLKPVFTTWCFKKN